MPSTSIVWFRSDLRLLDNSALLAAAGSSQLIVPVYIHNTEEEGRWPSGAASRWWLHESLASLDKGLASLGSRLIIRRGESLKVLLSLIEETGARSVFFNRVYHPLGICRDARVMAGLSSRGVLTKAFNSSLLHDPDKLRTNEGKAFKVFTPFWNRLTASTDLEAPGPGLESMASPAGQLDSIPLAALELKPRVDWCAGIRSTWEPGERGAHEKLYSFLAGGLSRYATARDHPGQDGVSMLSPYLHFGEIGPRQIWHAVQNTQLDHDRDHDRQTYLKELGWREFAYHVLFNFPHTSDRALRPDFERFPWCQNKHNLKAWQRGRTGYPIVDAGMRQLWHTGWMHNRVRMITASFLTKDLLIPWLDGARWFWDTLVDADLASNSLGWQWAAGCGADAAPYFRIFNPVLQGQKFDPNGDYVRRWVPELARLPSQWIHSPWLAPLADLAAAGVALGTTYPVCIVDHGWARQRALDALSTIKVGDRAIRGGSKAPESVSYGLTKRRRQPP